MIGSNREPLLFSAESNRGLSLITAFGQPEPKIKTKPEYKPTGQ